MHTRNTVKGYLTGYSCVTLRTFTEFHIWCCRKIYNICICSIQGHRVQPRVKQENITSLVSPDTIFNRTVCFWGSNTTGHCSLAGTAEEQAQISSVRSLWSYSYHSICTPGSRGVLLSLLLLEETTLSAIGNVFYKEFL